VFAIPSFAETRAAIYELITKRLSVGRRYVSDPFQSLIVLCHELGQLMLGAVYARWSGSGVH